MRALILADLHHDQWDEAGRDPFEGIESAIAGLDLLILAGDLTNKPQKRWATALGRLGRLLPSDRIHVFAGNHDFYEFRLDEEARLADFAKEAGAHYCNMKEIRMGAVRFLCATLWTDHALAPGRPYTEYHLPQKMKDYKAIRVASGGYRRVRPRDLIQKHLAHKTWLRARLEEPFSGKTIVVTHHAPHPGVLIPHKDEIDAAYASDLEPLILETRPDEWHFGHCHKAHEITVGHTALRNASLGYPWDVDEPQSRILSLIRTF